MTHVFTMTEPEKARWNSFVLSVIKRPNGEHDRPIYGFGQLVEAGILTEDSKATQSVVAAHSSGQRVFVS